MSTIATLTSNENGADSLTDINNNFSALNTDKVEGQASSVDSEVALFSGTGGKTIKRATGTGIVRVSSGVYGTPGNVVESEITLADNTTNNVSTTKHGLVPKAPNDATKFLDGTGAFDTVKDSDLSFSDITTNNVSATAHGLAPKFPNNTTTFLRGDGTYAAPSSTVVTVYTDSASNNLKWSDDAQTSTSALTYTKIKEIVLNDDLGAVRIKFDLQGPSPTAALRYGRIYKNGVAIGTERSNNGTVATYSEDFTNFSSGDLIQIYAKTSDAGFAAQVLNLRLYFDRTVTKLGNLPISTTILGTFITDPTNNS